MLAAEYCGFFYVSRIKNSYLIYTKDFQVGENELLYIPFYMTGMI